MANRYWVGGVASWDGTAGTKWATTSGGAGGASVPTSADDVFFDINSGSGAVIIASGNTGAKSVDCTGFTGTLTGTSAISVAGSFILWSLMNFVYSGNLSITGPGTLNSGGKTFNGLIYVNFVGTLTLASNITTNSQFGITNATVAMETYSITCRDFLVSSDGKLSATSANPVITVTGNNRYVVSWQNNIGLSTTCPANLTFVCNYSGSTGTRTFFLNFPATNTPTISITNGLDSIRFDGGSFGIGDLIFGSSFGGAWINNSSSSLIFYGDITLGNSMTCSHTATIFFRYNTVTLTSPINVKTWPGITIQDSANVLINGDFYTNGNITLTSGSIDGQGYNISASNFSSSGTLARTINLGTGIWSITGSEWNCATSTNLTVNPSTSTISMASPIFKNFRGGGKTYYILNTGSGGDLYINQSNVFYDITATYRPSTILFAAGATQTVSNFTLSGISGSPVTLLSTVDGSQFTLSKSSGTVTANYLSIKDSNATGGAVWNALNGTNVDLGNISGWLFPSSGSAFMQFF
jgi:hypothetical protein